ncbi:Pre-mRNA-splicing factor cwc26 [Agyrium rufum]|nr:Pre-mRNA-splicing factor cwc26 [Agyrium rufum]
MSLAAYLAKNYLSADTKPEKKSKKRKRKDASSSGLIIADDSTLGWEPSSSRKRGRNDDEDDDDNDIAGSTQPSTSFRKSKSSSWKTITGAPATLPDTTDASTADQILRSAAADQAARTAAESEAADPAPTIVNDNTPTITKMSSGAHAGLQTASFLNAQLAAAASSERALLLASTTQNPAAAALAQETIYRDASGRIINVNAARAEARRKEDEEERKRVAALEAQRGDVQRRQGVERKKELEDARFLGVARYADDEGLNEELRARERWDDPMAGMLSRGREKGADGDGAGGGVVGESGGGGVKGGGKQSYKGAAAPNRYGIRPGYRWDGVDRGNGFEGEWFKARNRKKDIRDLEYQWQMDE